MKKSLLLFTTLLFTPATVAFAQNAAPMALSAAVKGSKVDLSWKRTDNGKQLTVNNFENAKFPGDGWTVQRLNTSDYRCSWFAYPTDDFTALDNYKDYIHGGEHSAMVYMDAGSHADGSSANQDEWLVSPALAYPAFVDFYSFIDPMVLSYGADEDFPDHYKVLVSFDDGQHWESLWDARYEATPFGGWQQVSLSLGSRVTDKTRIAFQAVGDKSNPASHLFFLWALDDINISGYQTRPETVETAAAGSSYYTVYCDGKKIADKVKALEYVDTLDKAPGTHTYKVAYFDVEKNAERDAAETTVDIALPTFNAPSNVSVAIEYDEEWDDYSAVIRWDAPEGGRTPDSYSIDCNGIEVAAGLTDHEFAQSGITKGVYDFQVKAVYSYPEGVSAGVGDEVVFNTRYPVRNLKARLDEEKPEVALEWQAPKETDGYKLSSYRVYRGNTLLKDGLTATSYIDEQAPQGVYDYSVVPVYDDGMTAMKRSVKVDNGGVEVVEDSLKEDFEGGMTPANWTVENYYPDYTEDTYMWRFDNFFELPVSGGGFKGDFASIDGLAAGMVSIVSTLSTPPVFLNLPSGSKLQLTFDLDYQTEGDAETALDYSLDNGETWEGLDTFQGYAAGDLAEGETCRPGKKVYDLTGKVKDGDVLMIRWGYNGTADGHIAIDNVDLSAINTDGIHNSSVADLLSYSVRNGFLTLKAGRNAGLLVYSADGALVARSGNGRLTTSAGHGVYIIKCTDNGKTTTRKIVVK